MEYKEGVMRNILEKTGGHIPTEFNDPRQANARFGYAHIGLGCVKSTFATGTFMSCPGGDESYELVSKVKEEAIKIKGDLEKEDAILHDGDSTFVTPLNGGSIGAHTEIVSRYDPNDKKAVRQVVKTIDKWNQAMFKQKLSIGAMEGTFMYCNDMHDLFGPACMNYDKWMKKIKKAFDPNSVGESSFYIVTEKKQET